MLDFERKKKGNNFQIMNTLNHWMVQTRGGPLEVQPCTSDCWAQVVCTDLAQWAPHQWPLVPTRAHWDECGPPLFGAPYRWRSNTGGIHDFIYIYIYMPLVPERVCMNSRDCKTDVIGWARLTELSYVSCRL